MKKSHVAAVALALLLTGCAAHFGDPKAYRDFGVRTGNVAYASVQVVADQYIVVSQEPIFVKQDTDNTIYWSLPPGGAYYFLPTTTPNPGIVFDNPQMPRTECDLYNGDKWTYVCTYKRANRAKYPYTIRVTNGTDIVKSDPTVMND